MASSIVISFRPTRIRASAAPGGGRRTPPRGGGGASWWTPLFGWPSEPDYIDAAAAGSGDPGKEDAESEGHHPPRRFPAFTEEKARELRMRTMETETFHDIMYHSAIASRLASDLPRRSDH